MQVRHRDGSAGDADYGVIGGKYAIHRRPDPRIAAQIERALGAARTVLNVGAGAGSYEPTDRVVTAVEPSASMRAQRPARLSPAIDGVAEHLPFSDASFDASLATFSVHQWSDFAAGLREMRCVTRGPVVIMTCDPDELDRFWLAAYAPEVIAVEARRYPPIAAALGPPAAAAQPVPILHDCADGFNEAYYARPECLLDPAARLACSAWHFVGETPAARFVTALGGDLSDGAWDRKYGHFRKLPLFDGSLKLVVAGAPKSPHEQLWIWYPTSLHHRGGVR
jgi:hypothetical protein